MVYRFLWHHLSSLGVRFGHNKCGKVLEAEVDQIYTLCQEHRSLRFMIFMIFEDAD